MINREERIAAILSCLSEEAQETDLPNQLHEKLMAKTDEEFDQVYDSIAKEFLAKYSPLKMMIPQTHIDLTISKEN